MVLFLPTVSGSLLPVLWLPAFKEKEYLGKLDNQKEVEKLLEQYILRFERDPKEEPELSRFHLFDAKGNIYQRSVTF